MEPLTRRSRLRLEPLEDRTTPSGLDPSFGNGGRIGWPVDQPGAVGFDEVSDVAALPDGRVVFAGHAQFAGGTDYNAIVGRLNPDGTPDLTFAGDGLEILDGIWYGTRIAILPDGAVVVAGEGYDNRTSPRVIKVVRLTATGELDPTFDGDGVLTIKFPEVGEYGQLASLAGIDAAADGSILLTGSVFVAPQPGKVTPGDFGVLRLTAAGQPDPSFGTGGLQTIQFQLTPEASYNIPRKVVALPDGKVLVAGSAVTGMGSLGAGLPYAVSAFAAARLNADGSLDPTFGNGGWTTVDFPGTVSASLSDVAALPDGGFVLAGEAEREQPTTFLDVSYAAARLTADGHLDSTFGDGGRVTIGGPEWFRTGTLTGVGVLADGRVLLAGMARSSPETEWRAAVVRLTPDGVPDPSYGRGGLFAFPFGDYPATFGEGVRSAGLFADGRMVLAGWVETSAGTASDLGFVVVLAEPGPDSLDLSYTPTELPPPPGVPPPLPARRTADLNGDGTDDVVSTTGLDGTLVRVVSGLDGSVLVDGHRPYEVSFTGGIRVLLADLDGDGRAEIITAPNNGGSARIQVFTFIDGTLLQRDNFFAFSDDPNHRTGATIAIGDINGDGRPELIVGAGGGPRIAIFDGHGLLGNAADPARLSADFFAFDPIFPGGVNVAATDMDFDGLADVVAGAGAGGGPRVRVFTGTSLRGGESAPLLDGFYGEDDLSSRNGIDLSTDLAAGKVVAPGPDGRLMTIGPLSASVE